MSSVLADFPARFAVEDDAIDGPAEGRVVLGRDQLVLVATEEQKVTIPLTAIGDVNVGSVPRVFDPLPGTPVTVAFDRHGDYQVSLVAADESTVEKFVTVLFKALLNGIHATIVHPAKLGGRVLDTDPRGAILSLQANAVQFETEEGAVSVRLDSVIDFTRETRSLGGREGPTLVVDHMQNRDAVTTLAAIQSPRKLGLLGRFLRREYRQLMSRLDQLSLSEVETEVLTAIYSTGDQDLSLTGMLDLSGERVKRVLHALHKKGLIESGNSGPALTPMGQVVVNQYLERVNE
jgi:helix-turn-helix protein